MEWVVEPVELKKGLFRRARNAHVPLSLDKLAAEFHSKRPGLDIPKGTQYLALEGRNNMLKEVYCVDDLVSIRVVKSKFMLTFWNPMDGNSKVVVALFGHKVSIRNLHARIAGCWRELNIPTCHDNALLATAMDSIDALRTLALEKKPWNELIDTARNLDTRCPVTEELRIKWKSTMRVVLNYCALDRPTGPRPHLWNAVEVFDQHISRILPGPNNATCVTGNVVSPQGPRPPSFERINLAVLPKVIPAFGYADATETALFNDVDQAIRHAFRTLDKDCGFLSHARFGFTEGLSVPVLLLGNIKRQHIAWASSPGDSVVIVESPGTIVLGTSILPPPPPLPDMLSGHSSAKGVQDEISVHADVVAACEAVLKGTAVGSDAKELRKNIRQNAGPLHSNGNFKVSALVSGKSIGRKGELMKGTFGLYLTTDDNAGIKYGLTALHVACPTPALSHPPHSVLCSPGGLDLATSIYQELRPFNQDPTILKSLLSHWETNRIGELCTGNIGVDNQGFRENWALLDVTGQKGRNGEWLDADVLEEFLVENWAVSVPTTLEIVGSREPKDGEVAIMSGATSFYTVGQVQCKRKTMGYQKRTATGAAIDGSEDMSEVDVCLHYQIWPIMGKERGAGPGDSGSAVFVAEKDGLAFAGMVVSLCMEDRPTGTEEDLDDFYIRTRLFVPPDRLFAQMEAKTRKKWRVCTN